MDLKEKVKSFPKNPGVYFFKNKNNKIIYIGKAKNLKNRVRSYFNKNHIDHKSKIMVGNAVSVEYLLVNDEIEAIITESNMIKEYKPKYNISLKDDKTFPYIIITKEPYPKIEIIRKKNLRKDGNIYFGPYTDVNYLRQVVKVLHRIFPIRTCSYYIDEKSISSKKIKVCLDYHIDKCQGPCEGLVSIKEYNDMIESVILFLKGRNSKIKNKLKSLMRTASNEFKYEEAARLRNQLIAVESFYKKQKKVSPDFNDRDIVHVSTSGIYGIGFVMRIRNGLLIGREKFSLSISDNSVEELLNSFLKQYYNNTFDIPYEIIVDIDLSSKELLEKWLSSIKNKKVLITKPFRGNRKKMLDLCIKNTQMLLKEIIIKKIKRKEHVPKNLQVLKEILSMSVIPNRIEAFDNSNTHGENPVAGMVCFVKGKPLKKEYRRFNIKTVSGIDDFESMREVVYRRYSRQIKEKKILPDLILIDGGRGQLSAAKSSLDKLGLGYISIIGLAKRLEEVFLPGTVEPQNISKTSPAIYLLRQIRDEVHRFAITFHKSKRSKSLFLSIFNNIKGMGPSRVKKIWANYDSLESLKNESIKVINQKTNIPLSILKEIKKTL